MGLEDGGGLSQRSLAQPSPACQMPYDPTLLHLPCAAVPRFLAFLTLAYSLKLSIVAQFHQAYQLTRLLAGITDLFAPSNYIIRNPSILSLA